MKDKIKKLEEAVLASARADGRTLALDPRWKIDLMRTIRLQPPKKDPLAGLGPLTWKWAVAAFGLTLLLSSISSKYGAMDDYLLQQTEIVQTADYLLTQAF
jgi:hypothetical protein